MLANDLTVRSFLKCPLCGKEMQLTNPAWYYETGIRVISLNCVDCYLAINQHPEWPEEKEGQVKFATMKERLYNRVIAKGVQKC